MPDNGINDTRLPIAQAVCGCFCLASWLPYGVHVFKIASASVAPASSLFPSVSGRHSSRFLASELPPYL